MTEGTARESPSAALVTSTVGAIEGVAGLSRGRLEAALARAIGSLHALASCTAHSIDATIAPVQFTIPNDSMTVP